MFPIATKQGGMSQAFPDVCKTPSPAGPIPVPYANVAVLPQANPASCSLKFKILNQPVLTKASVIMMTSGDEPGAAGGVMSSMIKGPGKAKKFSMKVKAEGKNVIYHTCVIGHNGNSPNAIGIHSVPSQMKVTVMG